MITKEKVLEAIIYTTQLKYSVIQKKEGEDLKVIATFCEHMEALHYMESYTEKQIYYNHRVYFKMWLFNGTEILSSYTHD